MTVKFQELPEWTFVTDEISAGIYKIEGKDAQRRSVFMTGGTHPEEMIENCKRSALEMMANRKIK